LLDLDIKLVERLETTV